MHIVLASQSPRRQQLLTGMGVTFTATPSDYDEHLDDSRDVRDVAVELALGKARSVVKRFPDACVIGSDTIVVAADGKQLEKPRNNDEASAMLRSHSKGGTNRVVSAVAIIYRGMQRTAMDETTVHFRPYTADLTHMIDEYVATGDPLDKAGGYGVQSGAGFMVNYIEGDYDTVIGFPTKLTAKLLNETGVPASPLEVDLPVHRIQ